MGGFTCDVCEESRNKGQVRRKCLTEGCQVHACACAPLMCGSDCAPPRSIADAARVTLLMGGDIETNPGPTNNLVVATLNVTSLDAHFDVLRDVPAHVVGLQETCSSRRQQEEVDWVLR